LFKFPGPPLLKYCLVALCSALVLTSCKLRIVVPEGGSVETLSGAYSCATGKTCTIDVVDFFFGETFVAKPADGYEFVFWANDSRRFCSKSSHPCYLSTIGLNIDTLAELMISFFNSDEVFYLEPIFVRSDRTGIIIDLEGEWEYLETLGNCTARGSFVRSIVPNTRACHAHSSPARQISLESTVDSCEVWTFTGNEEELTVCSPVKLPSGRVSEGEYNAAWAAAYGISGGFIFISPDEYRSIWPSGKVVEYNRAKSETTASFRRPVYSPHEVTQPYNGKYITDKFHTGVDYVSDSNLALATNYGRVVRIQVNGEGCRVGCNKSECDCKDKGFGNTIILEHNLFSGVGAKTYSMYAHLADFDAKVREGVCVSPGQVLGKIGGTGFGSVDAYRPHLHFEIKTTNTLTNPSGSGTYFGYTPTNADNFGFADPYLYIISPANQTAAACN